MSKRIIAATATLLLLTATSCAPSAHFNRMVYVGSPYTYGSDELPILVGNDNEPRDPGRHWHNEWRGRNWK